MLFMLTCYTVILNTTLSSFLPITKLDVYLFKSRVNKICTLGPLLSVNVKL